MLTQNQEEQQPKDILDLVAQKLNQSFRTPDGRDITYQQARIERVIADVLNGKAYANKQLAEWEKQKRERDTQKAQAKEQGKAGTVKEMLEDCARELMANRNAMQESSNILTVAHFLEGAKEAIAQACVPVLQQEEILSALCAKHHLRPIPQAMYNFANEHFNNALRMPTTIIRNLQFALDGQKPMCEVWICCGNDMGKLSPILLPYLDEEFYTTSVQKSFEGTVQKRFQEALQYVAGHGQDSSISITSQMHKIEDGSSLPDNSLAETSEVTQLTPEQAQFMEQVRKLSSVDISSAHAVQQAHQELINLTKNRIYSTLSQSERGQVRFTLNTLKEHLERLEETQVQQLQNQAYERAGAGLSVNYYEDAAANLRQEPFDASKIPLQDDEIWNQRFAIAKEYNVEKAELLVKEFANRSLAELEDFMQFYNKKIIESWERTRIFDPLQYAIEQRQSQVQFSTI